MYTRTEKKYKYVKETDCMCINVTYQRMPIPIVYALCAFVYMYSTSRKSE